MFFSSPSRISFLEQPEREEPRISEYMATISRLGREIEEDQLYAVAKITKNSKNKYNEKEEK